MEVVTVVTSEDLSVDTAWPTNIPRARYTQDRCRLYLGDPSPGEGSSDTSKLGY